MKDLQVGNKIVILNLKDEMTGLKKRYGQEKNLMKLHRSESFTGKITEINGNDCLVEFGEYNRNTDEFKSFGLQKTFTIEYLMKYSKKLI